MLTLLLNNLISLAARKSRRKPTFPAHPVASIMLPTTVIKSNVFHESLKYAYIVNGRKYESLFNLFVKLFISRAPQRMNKTTSLNLEHIKNRCHLPLGQMK